MTGVVGGLAHIRTGLYENRAVRALGLYEVCVI
jgi:hypothetical protein